MATSDFTVWDPDQVTLAFGPILVDGLADGEFFTLELSGDGFSKKVGTDGKVARSKLLDRSGSVTFKLMQTSETNDKFSAVYNLDLAAPNGAGVGPLLINDRNGRTKIAAAQAWIAKAPDISYDREAGTYEWRIDFAKGVIFWGGN